MHKKIFKIFIITRTTRITIALSCQFVRCGIRFRRDGFMINAAKASLFFKVIWIMSPSSSNANYDLPNISLMNFISQISHHQFILL